MINAPRTCDLVRNKIIYFDFNFFINENLKILGVGDGKLSNFYFLFFYLFFVLFNFIFLKKRYFQVN